MNDIRVGFAMTGSFCTFAGIVPIIGQLREAGAELTPIMSENAYNTDTRFGKAEDWIKKISAVCQKEIIHTINDAEPIGPKGLLDVLVVAPCTGNTLAKLAHGITDTCVTMACKSHLRNGRPVVLAVSTNDGLSQAAANIGVLQPRRNVYFVPYGQDNAAEKPASLVADFGKIAETIQMALQGKQIQPLLL